jgi:hypothetical protein
MIPCAAELAKVQNAAERNFNPDALKRIPKGDGISPIAGIRQGSGGSKSEHSGEVGLHVAVVAAREKIGSDSVPNPRPNGMLRPAHCPPER